MSGTIAKTLSFLSFLILAIGLVMAAPISDAVSYSGTSGSGTSEDPYSGTVDIELDSFAGKVLYVVLGSTINIEVTGSATFNSFIVTGSSITDIPVGTYEIPSTFSFVLTEDILNGYQIGDDTSYSAAGFAYKISSNSTIKKSFIFVAVDDGSNSIENPVIGGNEVSYVDDEGDEITTEIVEDEGYSYWLAVIIIAVLLIAVIWLIKKVKG